MSADRYKGAERDWVFARRFAVRRMIESGDTSAADRIPEIPDVGALADENERLREVIDSYAPPDGRYVVICDDRSIIATDDLMEGDDVLVDRGTEATR